MSGEVLKQIKQLLDDNNVNYDILRHKPVFTSIQAAKVRETPLESGAKALILRSEGKFYMFVISAAKKVDFKKIKKILNTKSVSMATAEEVLRVSRCKVGAIPPFGNLFGLKIYVDKSLLSQKNINFNAGKLDTSISMKCEDYVNTVDPIIENFGE